MRFNLYIYFIKSIFWINLAVSGLFAIFAPVQPSLFGSSFLSGFALFFTTFGYAMTLLFFHYFGKRTKYMYFNLGISLFRLYLVGFLFNLLFVFVLYAIVRML